MSIGQGVQSTVISVGFALLLVGTNAINPLLPVYRTQLGFDPLLLSLTFVVYVVVLIATLLTFTRPGFAQFAPISVAASLLLAVVADLLLATATEGGVLAGRAIAGIAGGVGTGASSSLVVAALGSRGRAVTATGNLFGAVIGSSFALAWVTHRPALAPAAIFQMHAVACALLFVVVVAVLVVRRGPNRIALQDGDTPRTDAPSRGLAPIPLGTGCIAWIAVSCGIVLLPLFFDDLGMGLARGAGPIIMLSASAIGQLAGPGLARVAPRASGMGALSAGSLLVILGGAARLEPAALAGFGLVGLGVGIAYRLGLVTVSLGATPGQSRIASLYAALTYASAAAAVLAAGAAGAAIGLFPVVVAIFAVLAAGSAGMLTRAPRLRTPVDPAGATVLPATSPR